LKIELDKIGATYSLHLLGRIGGKESYSIEFYISENDPRCPYIQDLIIKYQFQVQTGMYYSEQDIASAEWLYANAGEYQYPQPEDGSYLQATYEISNYCMRCGMGATQNRPFRLKMDFKQRTNQFLGLHWVFDEIFIRPIAKSIIEDEGVTGIEYIHPVLDRTSEAVETVFQMKIKTTVRPGMITDDLNTVTCKENNEEWKFGGIRKGLEGYPFCGRVKYSYPRRDSIKFRRECFDRIPDIVRSHEYFGTGRAAHQLILVSRKFVDIVTKKKFRGLKFTPISLV